VAGRPPEGGFLATAFSYTLVYLPQALAGVKRRRCRYTLLPFLFGLRSLIISLTVRNINRGDGQGGMSFGEPEVSIATRRPTCRLFSISHTFHRTRGIPFLGSFFSDETGVVGLDNRHST